MLKKCYNCCEAVAVARCHQCPAEDSFYCSHCKELHTLVKVSKTHTFTDIILICENCECEPASEQCRECSSILEQDSMFCRNCARVHVKIRQFQGHSLDEISNYSNSSLYQGANVEPTSTSTTDDSEHSLRTSGEDGQSAPSPYFSAGIVDPSTLSSWASSWYSDIEYPAGQHRGGGKQCKLEKRREGLRDRLRSAFGHFVALREKVFGLLLHHCSVCVCIVLQAAVQGARSYS